jgi:hypothetical protein
MKTQKLSLEGLKQRAEAIATNELLESINGGLLDACHDAPLTGILEIDAKRPVPAPTPTYQGTQGPWK